jgi:sulfate transport system permease protein
MGMREKKTGKILLIIACVFFIAVMLILPLITIFAKAFEKGTGVFWAALRDQNTMDAVRLTLFTTAVAIVASTAFGVVAAFAISKFEFRGKNVLTTLISLPFSVSPVVAGLAFVVIFGRSSFLYPFLENNGIKIIFSTPGIIIATLFITAPFVARELIPLMQSQGHDEEDAAALMGANLFTIFFRIILPNIKWGLLYGVILCSARAMGEFGAVSVVSGHLRGKTVTLPLHVEILYNEYQFSAAFAVSSILVVLAVILLVLRNIVEHYGKKEEKSCM